MKVLLVLDDTPLPANSGGRHVLLNESKGLTDVVDSVSAVIFFRSGEDMSSATPLIEASFDRTIFKKRSGFLRSTIRAPHLPFQSVSRTLGPRELEIVASWPAPDVIIAHHEWTLRAAEQIRRLFPSARLVLRSHNDEVHFMKALAVDASGVRGAYLNLESYRTSSRWVRESISTVDRIWTISDSDMAAYSLSLSKVRTLATVAGDFEPRRGEARRPASPTIGFLGALDMPQAVAGLQWFIAKVLPEVIDRNPSVKFVVAGRRADQAFAREMTKNRDIEFLGEIDRVDEFYDAISLFVNPVFSGSGINIKMLAPAARGIPIVSTSMGLRGLEKLSLRAADNPIQFVEQISDVIQSEELSLSISRSLTENARAFSTSAFADWIQHELNDLVRDRVRDKITFLTCASGIWGAEQSLFRIANELAKGGHQVRIICNGGNVAEFFRRAHNVQVVEMASSGGGRLAVLREAWGAWQRIETDGVTVVFSLDLMPLALLASIEARRKMYFDIHDTPQKWITRVVMRSLAPFYAGAIAISGYSLHWAHGFKRSSVVARPIDRAPKVADPVETKFLRVGIVGRLVPEKRIELVIDAVSLCSSSIVLYVFGSSFGDDVYASQLRAYGDRALGSRVHWMGNQPQEILYEGLDVVVIANEREPSGRTAGEAMAHGVVPIVPDSGGAAEYVDRGLTGLLFDSGNPASLAKAITTLVDSRVRWRIAAQARYSVAQTRSIEYVAARYEAAIGLSDLRGEMGRDHE